MIRRSPAWALLVLISLTSLPARAQKKGAKEAPSSTAITKEVLGAVAIELQRAMSEMHIPGAPAPYFLGYKLTEVEVNDVVASLGAAIDDKERHFVSLEAHVHVGSYDKDNSNFVAPRRENLDGNVTIPLSLEASPSRFR